MNKYLIAIITICLLLFSFCGCGEVSDPNEPPVIPNHLRHEPIEGTTLTLDNSKITVYPNGTSDNKDAGLDVGVTVSEDNTVILDDILFVLERLSANGVGETVWSPVYSGDNADVRISSTISFTEVDGGVSLDQSGDMTTVRYNDFLQMDESKDTMILLSVSDITLGEVKDTESNTPGWNITGSIKYDTAGNWSKKSQSLSWMPMPDYTGEGRFCYYLSDDLKNHLEVLGHDYETLDVAITPVINVRGKGTKLTVTDYALVQTECGYQTSENPAEFTGYTDVIESAIAYPNGSAIKVSDYYSNEYTVVRKLTLTEPGLIAICGKVDKNVAYDGTEYAITGKSNGVEYAITTDQYRNIKFYDSLEALYSEDGKDFPDNNTKYWAIPCFGLEVGDSVYMAVSADTEGTEVDLVSTARYAIDALYRIEK